MKKFIFFLCCFLGLLFTSTAQTVTLLNANSTSSTPEFEAYDVAVDKNGNKVVVGKLGHRGTHDFDPSGNTVQFNAPSASETGFIASYSPDGKLNFALHITDADIPPQTYNYLIDTDDQNNIYVLGVYRGKIDLDPGAGVFEIRASNSFEFRNFLASYTSSGAFRFAIDLPYLTNIFEPTLYNNNIINKTMCVDNAGNSYLLLHPSPTGFYDLDPGPGETLSPIGKCVVSYNQNGEFRFVYAVPFQTLDIGCSPSGDHYIIGNMLDDTFDFDPGAGVYYVSNADNSAFFFASYTQNGALKYVNDIKGPNAIPMMILGSPEGDVFVVGKMAGVLDFDPGNGQFEVTVSTFDYDPSGDIFLARYSESGELLFAEAMEDKVGQVCSEIITDFKIDRDGNCYLTGNLQGGVVDFDPTQNNILINGGSAKDLFVAVYDKNGGALFAHAIPNSGIGYSSLDIDANCPYYTLVGTIGEGIQLDLDPGPGTASVFTQSGSGNNITIYLATLQASGVTVHSDCMAVPTIFAIPTNEAPQLFPNPSTGILNVVLGGNVQTVDVNILNAFGELVLSQPKEGEVFTLDCSQLPSGIYTLKITQNKGFSVKKVIIQR